MCMLIVTTFGDKREQRHIERCPEATPEQRHCSRLEERRVRGEVVETKPAEPSSSRPARPVLHQKRHHSRPTYNEFDQLKIDFHLRAPKYQLINSKEDKRSKHSSQFPKDGGSYGLPAQLPSRVPPSAPDPPAPGTYFGEYPTYILTSPSASSSRATPSEAPLSSFNDSGYASIPPQPRRTATVVPDITTHTASTSASVRGRDRDTIPIPPTHTTTTACPPHRPSRLHIPSPNRNRPSSSSSSSSYPPFLSPTTTHQSYVSNPGLSRQRVAKSTFPPSYRDSAMGTSVGSRASPTSPTTSHPPVHLPSFRFPLTSPLSPSALTSPLAPEDSAALEPSELENQYERSLLDRGAERQRLRDLDRLKREDEERERDTRWREMNRAATYHTLEGRSGISSRPTSSSSSSSTFTSAFHTRNSNERKREDARLGEEVPRRSDSDSGSAPRRFNRDFGYYDDSAGAGIGFRHVHGPDTPRRGGMSAEGMHDRPYSPNPYPCSPRSPLGDSLGTTGTGGGDRERGGGAGRGEGDEATSSSSRTRRTRKPRRREVREGERLTGLSEREELARERMRLHEENAESWRSRRTTTTTRREREREDSGNNNDDDDVGAGSCVEQERWKGKGKGKREY